MKIALKYTRLAKPRGGWFYPLWFKFGPEWEEGEAESLVPSWSYDRLGKKLDRLESYRYPNRKEPGWSYLAASDLKEKLKQAKYQAVETTWYFSTHELREEAVRRLHQEVEVLREIVVAWMAENEAVPGDDEQTEVVYTLKTTSDSETAPAMAGARRYQL